MLQCMAKRQADGPLDWAIKWALEVLAFTFLALAAGLLVLAVVGLFRGMDSEAKKTVGAVSDVLLAVILIELAETIHRQLSRDVALSLDLLSDLLVVGVVAAVRHLLAVSAHLTLTQSSPDDLNLRRSLMLEFGLTAVIVVLLAAWWWVMDRAKRPRIAQPRKVIRLRAKLAELRTDLNAWGKEVDELTRELDELESPGNQTSST
jgi:uncharacterized membrane protein (DUF373 family)